MTTYEMKLSLGNLPNYSASLVLTINLTYSERITDHHYDKIFEI
jgi:hypothetical protein